MNKLFALMLAAALPAVCMAKKSVTLSSPDGRVKAEINLTGQASYSVSLDGNTLIEPSAIAIETGNGKVVGANLKNPKVKRTSVSTAVESPFYRATSIPDNYNELTANINSDWNLVFRAYNDGVAYRWYYKSKKPATVTAETIEYVLVGDPTATAPYVRSKGKDKAANSFDSQFFNSFENIYTVTPASGLESDRLIFLPMSVKNADGNNVLFTESALIDYPGLYLNKSADACVLKGVFAPYPKTEVQGGHNNLQMLVTEREDYIARITGPRGLPWRIAIVADNDKALAQSNLSFLLGEPSRLSDTSWIKPGKVAWDWWNDWNLDGVDFVTGVNNDTYKAYIDFAAANGIEYVILDEGWAVSGKADLLDVVPEIDLPMLVEYGASKGVGLILWAGYHAFDRDMEKVVKHYADMGIKGFKVDFMDRDDQKMTAFNARAAETAAKYRMILDLHGTHKPAGLNRTYPNVLNFEGVNGLEQVKWSKKPHDQVTYDTQIPFLRQAAGPMDYTQGAMRNAVYKNYYPSRSEPMSQGTRTRQLALYMIFDSPFLMLCDTPSAYMREQECTDFMAGVPTVWDETVVVDGKMGEYIVTARRKGNDWYIGAITNWDARDLDIDLSFLTPGESYRTETFADGVNAHRIARDYKRTTGELKADGKPMRVHLAPGGGFATHLSPM
ncbi:MAG: glycoside hydrolase family 97 protein [Muribaculaceae bacterium]